MKLYVNKTSPYVRIVRIVINEKELCDRVEVLHTETRRPNSLYYQVNPSGRVPYLLCDDGIGLEGSDLIAAYLDHLDGKPTLHMPLAHQTWEYGRLQARGRSLVDGMAVLVRELHRPNNEQSLNVIEHERQRSRRLADLWDAEIEHPLMTGALNMPQIVLIAGVLLKEYFPDVDLLSGRSRLLAWAQRLIALPSIKSTMRLNQLGDRP